MKFAKLKAFFTGQKIETPITEKGDGTVALTAEQAAAAETLAGELESARTELANAQENLNTAQSEIATLRTNADALTAAGNQVRTALELDASATTEEVVTAISNLNTRIAELGEQPGSMGANVTKGKDESEDKPSFLTSIDMEARAALKELGK